MIALLAGLRLCDDLSRTSVGEQDSPSLLPSPAVTMEIEPDSVLEDKELLSGGFPPPATEVEAEQTHRVKNLLLDAWEGISIFLPTLVIMVLKLFLSDRMPHGLEQKNLSFLLK